MYYIVNTAVNPLIFQIFFSLNKTRKLIGVPEEFIESASKIKVTTIICKDDEGYTISRIRPNSSVTNKIILGSLCELDTVNGDKIKVSIRFLIVYKY